VDFQTFNELCNALGRAKRLETVLVSLLGDKTEMRVLFASFFFLFFFFLLQKLNFFHLTLLLHRILRDFRERFRSNVRLIWRLRENRRIARKFIKPRREVGVSKIPRLPSSFSVIWSFSLDQLNLKD